jgi:hypothetical protein
VTVTTREPVALSMYAPALRAPSVPARDRATLAAPSCAEGATATEEPAGAAVASSGAAEATTSPVATTPVAAPMAAMPRTRA